MTTYWQVKDVAVAVGRCVTTVHNMIRRGAIKPSARTKRGDSLFDPRAVRQAIAIVQKTEATTARRRVVRNRHGDVVIVDGKGRCTDCGAPPAQCSPDDHK